jgi:hypothetical protein
MRATMRKHWFLIDFAVFNHFHSLIVQARVFGRPIMTRSGNALPH